MADAYINVGTSPNFAMLMRQIIYRHTVSISFIQNEIKQQMVFSNNSQIEVVKGLQSFFRGKELHGAAKLKWKIGDILTGSIREMSIQVSLTYKLPTRLTAHDKSAIYKRFMQLLDDF
jgi:translation elongation factor P/translation initiation factor 5A